MKRSSFWQPLGILYDDFGHMPWHIVMCFGINILGRRAEQYICKEFSCPPVSECWPWVFFTVMVKHLNQSSWHLEFTYLLIMFWLMSENYVISLSFQKGGNSFDPFRAVTLNRLTYWKKYIFLVRRFVGFEPQLTLYVYQYSTI